MTPASVPDRIILMGFLKRILRAPSSDTPGNSVPAGSFELLTDEELQTHMGIRQYGMFELTDAVRPSYDLQVVPRQGFRRDEYRDDNTGKTIPVLMASRRKGLQILAMDPAAEMLSVASRHIAVELAPGLPLVECDAVLIERVFVNGSAHLVARFAGVVRWVQSGYIYHYAFAMLLGVIVLMTYFVSWPMLQEWLRK